MQLDVTSSQLLVTDSVFRDEGFRKQLSETVKALLKLRVIPIFNENDAVSTRKAPYEVCNSTCSYTLSVEFVLICNLFAPSCTLLHEVATIPFTILHQI